MDYNYGLFVQDGVKISIFDKVYKIGFIPYSVEKEIFQNLDKIQKDLGDLTKVEDDTLDKWCDYIEIVLTHKRNENNIEGDLFEDMGLMEVVSTMGIIIQYITKRILKMNDVFAEPTEPKKKQTARSRPSTKSDNT